MGKRRRNKKNWRCIFVTRPRICVCKLVQAVCPPGQCLHLKSSLHLAILFRVCVFFPQFYLSQPSLALPQISCSNTIHTQTLTRIHPPSVFVCARGRVHSASVRNLFGLVAFYVHRDASCYRFLMQLRFFFCLSVFASCAYHAFLHKKIWQ